MDMNQCKRKYEGEPKNIPINIKIGKNLSDWIHENKLSPTAIFTQACEEMGFK